MEGIQLSIEQTQKLMLSRGEIVGKDLKDCNQVQGHDDAIAEIKVCIKEKRLLSEHFIRGLHEILLKEPYYNPAITPNGLPTEKLVTLGKYKDLPNDVETSEGLFRFASPTDTPILMGELIEWCNGQFQNNTIHPLFVATQFHYRFIRIHPFDDGNGRMARLLTNYILLFFDYPPLIIETQKKSEYIKALRRADKGSLAELKKFFGLNLIDGINRYISAAKGNDIMAENDFEKKVLLLSKKLEIGYMKTAKSNRVVVETLQNVYAPLIAEMAKKVHALSHLFAANDWCYFKEPEDGKIPVHPMSWNIPSIMQYFVAHAEVKDSFHNFKIMNWMTSLRSEGRKVDVEVAFRLYCSDFKYKIMAYIGMPMESAVLMGAVKSLLNTLSRLDKYSDGHDNPFTGFEIKICEYEYGVRPLKEDMIKWANEVGNQLVNYIEEKAKLNPELELSKKEKERQFFKRIS
jgi:Fic family protein